MTTVSVSLPKALHSFVKGRTKAGGFDSASDYLQELIRADQKRLRTLEQMLLDGLNSGEPIEVDKAYWARKKATLRKKFGKKAV